MVDSKFWENKKVLITGCTGFKGSWLSVWLSSLKAKLYGYSLTPPTTPSMWEMLSLESLYTVMHYADIRDYSKLKNVINEVKPEIIIHMAAQPLVRYSYLNPRETYEVNVMGVVNLLDAIRELNLNVVVVNVTTDKCYENKEWIWPYRENEALGGHDPYSNSKACSELVTQAYRDSFFAANSKIKLGSARAGNVIGGGDFTADRLIPDIINHFKQKKEVKLRYPNSIRPWQHVLEPLSGYLTLAQAMYQDCSGKFCEAWNFGPLDIDNRTVARIAQTMCDKWGDDAKWTIDGGTHPHEAATLKLDCAKALNLLNWHPVWDIDTTLDKLIIWYRAQNLNAKELLDLTIEQIESYTAS